MLSLILLVSSTPHVPHAAHNARRGNVFSLLVSSMMLASRFDELYGVS